MSPANQTHTLDTLAPPVHVNQPAHTVFRGLHRSFDPVRGVFETVGALPSRPPAHPPTLRATDTSGTSLTAVHPVVTAIHPSGPRPLRPLSLPIQPHHPLATFTWPALGTRHSSLGTRHSSTDYQEGAISFSVGVASGGPAYA